MHLAEVVLDLLVDLADDALPDHLELGRHVVVGSTGQRATYQEAEQDHDHTGDERAHHGVDVDGHPEPVALGVHTGLDVDLVRYDGNHAFFSSLRRGRVVITSATSRKIAKPSSRPIPEGQKAIAIAIATTDRIVSRMTVANISLPRVGCSPEVITLSSQSSVARWLSRPRKTPTAMQVASVQSPYCPNQRPRTIIASATRTALRWSRRTFGSILTITGAALQPRSTLRTLRTAAVQPRTTPSAMPTSTPTGDAPVQSSTSSPRTMP